MQIYMFTRVHSNVPVLARLLILQYLVRIIPLASITTTLQYNGSQNPYVDGRIGRIEQSNFNTIIHPPSRVRSLNPGLNRSHALDYVDEPVVNTAIPKFENETEATVPEDTITPDWVTYLYGGGYILGAILCLIGFCISVVILYRRSCSSNDSTPVTTSDESEMKSRIINDECSSPADTQL